MIFGRVVDASAADHGGTDNPALAPESTVEQVMPSKPEFTDEELSSMVANKVLGPPQPPISKWRHAAPQVKIKFYISI